LDWNQRRKFRVSCNSAALEEVTLMMHGLPRDAAGFAELERRVEQKKRDLRNLLELWKSGDQ
jgi:hypothetical protein